MDPVSLLEELIGIDSVNVSMGGRGEAAIAERVGTILRGLGCAVAVLEVEPGQPNVIATLGGDPALPVLMLQAHLDTVLQPMVPLTVKRIDGRVYGRGACDTKGSLAAMIAAVERFASRDRRPTVVLAGVMDEEAFMTGSLALLDQIPKIDAAIVGEPTSLVPVRAHNGLVRFRIVARGRSAHTSRAHLGVNAVTAAARVVLAIEANLGPRLASRLHPLTGAALVTPSVIRGGSAVNLVPEWCEIEVDRRLAPGEDPQAALAEIDAVLEELRAAGDDVVREAPTALKPGLETPADHPLIRAAEAAATAMAGRPVTAIGVPYGTDAANLSGIGGIPCVVLGPGSIDQAHSANEWIAVEEVERAVDLYVCVIDEFVAGADR